MGSEQVIQTEQSYTSPLKEQEINRSAKKRRNIEESNLISVEDQDAENWRKESEN